jgi:hypothetical protein
MRRLPLFVFAPAPALLLFLSPPPPRRRRSRRRAREEPGGRPLLRRPDHLPELAILRKGLAQMLITDLVAAGGFEVVERARLQEILDELALGQSTKIDQATPTRSASSCRRALVKGSYIELPGAQLLLDANVVDVERGLNVHSIRASGKKEDFLEMEQKVASGLSAFLAGLVRPGDDKPAKTGAAEDPAAAPKAPKAPRPKVAVQTVVRYSKALDALDRKDKERPGRSWSRW